MGTIQSWLLLVCHPVPDVRHRFDVEHQEQDGKQVIAILFLMFDIETVFLFPWAVVASQVGVYALVSVGFFLVVLILGLAYAWRKGALEWK